MNQKKFAGVSAISSRPMQSWSALMGALGETRAAFDRANKAAQEAFERAAP